MEIPPEFGFRLATTFYYVFSLVKITKSILGDIGEAGFGAFFFGGHF